MTNEFDSDIDLLADAALTPEQRKVLTSLRSELASAHAKNQELAEKLRKFEQQQADGEPTLLNRPDFNREVARMLAFDERYGGISSVLYFDFEKLEDVATQFGREVANKALRQIGSIMLRGVRSSDIVGRLAPDEFGILLMRCDNEAAWRKADALAIQIQKALAEVQGCKLDIKVSFGAYTFRDNEDLATGLKEAAQKLLQAVK